MINKRQKTTVSAFYIIILLYLFTSINSVSVYILENAKELDNSSKITSLSFQICGGVAQGFNEDKFFKIETEIYKDSTLLSTKNAECKIPMLPEADFGTKINMICDIDLLSSQNANNIKFIGFNINESEDLKINDNKNYVLGNILNITKKIEFNSDIEFIAESMQLIKCSDDKIFFNIKGEYTSVFIRGFTFDMILNDNEKIKAKCLSPDIFVSKEETINCTLIISNDNNFKESLKNGIELKESYFNTININNEKKILKMKIKDDNNKIVLKEISCDKGGFFNLLKGIFTSNKNNEKINKEEEEQKKWEKLKEEETRRKKERENREREEEKRRRDQEELEKSIKIREREREEKEKKNNYNNNRENNYEEKNKDNYNQRIDDDIIDYNSNVKLIHLQIRYSYGFIYYMFYALTPVPLGHKIKVRFLITKYDYESGYNNQEYKYIILKSEDEITRNDRNIIIEYIAKYDCQQCQKLIIQKNSIQGAKIYNIPEDEYFLDAISTNKNNYLTKSTLQSPPLYVVDNIFTQNCMINLGGSFFNKNTFFPSKFPLKLINTGYNNNKNITVYCSLNERSIFTCPINENIENFLYKLEQFVIDQKENIIIDNSYYANDGTVNRASCQLGNDNKNNFEKSKEELKVSKGWNWKRLMIIIIILVILYYLRKKYCGEKEEEYSDEYNSRWRVSSSSYNGGETHGLRSRGW